MASVRPIEGRAPPAAVAAPATQRAHAVTLSAVPQPAPPRPHRPVAPGVTLDGGWDRRLSRGMVAPDRTIDLHGHTLQSAYSLLDHALDRAIRDGSRVILLVTGKPPRKESERPHARGAIRAAVGDWLAASRHADRIAAVRGAHPRHGGTGALYIVLRRDRQAP
ncbi:Smr/MutS family protein [Sphingomonas donggukensis]|uniref:Smr/MutS family protein n=1 Tax=Sphingomonas donggukensis TaxID=2949093 RepID=A0ABY4TUU2_9SPHN|nr:Smr/MutS family protein [Sphingomonas donggukensis]URW76169.1 Smr/MutS family protein [Sphingomonas donggukensis]